MYVGQILLMEDSKMKKAKLNSAIDKHDHKKQVAAAARVAALRCRS